jgi:hypothetical protein
MKKHKFFIITILLLFWLIANNFVLNAQDWPPTGMAGTGSSSNPWKIETAEHLEALADCVNAGNSGLASGYFILMNDIDLQNYSNWKPIGDYSTKNNNSVFRGNFNGNGKVVRNLKINRPTEDYIGLFGRAYAKIANLGIENCNITGDSDVGGLVGYIISFSTYTTDVTISNCYTSGSVAGTSGVGGLAGIHASHSTITDCYSTCNVSGASRIGGLLGVLYGDEVRVYDSYATGNISATGESIGGLFGATDGDRILIANCVAANESVYTSSYTTNINRISGSRSIYYDTYTNNYANSSMSVKNGSGNVTITDASDLAGTGKDLATLQSLNFYMDRWNWNLKPWKFDGYDPVWNICDGKTLSWLKWQGIDCGGVGIKESDMLKFKIFPNPIYDKFAIELDGVAFIILYDMIGKEVHSQYVGGNSEINIIHLQKGIYFINVISEGKIIGNSKIVKQ